MKTIIYNRYTRVIEWSGDTDLYKSPEFDGFFQMGDPNNTLLIDVPEYLENITSLEKGAVFPVDWLDQKNITNADGIPVDTP